MKIELISTKRIVKFRGAQARVWEGKTSTGIRCYALIPLIAHSTEDDHRAEEFMRELFELKNPSHDAQRAFPAENMGAEA